MAGQQDLIPCVIIAGTALYSGAKIGIAVGLLVCPPAAVLAGYIGGLSAQYLAMRRFEETQTPYADAGKALLSLGIQMLPDPTTDLPFLADPLPDAPDPIAASPPSGPHPPRRPSLLARMAVASQAPSPS